MSNENAKKYFAKGLKLYTEKQFDLAQKSFEEALALSPNRPSVLRNLALVYFINKNYLKANEVLEHLENFEQFDDDLNELKFKVLKNLNRLDKLENFFIKNKNFIKKDVFYDLFNKLIYPSFFNSQLEIDNKRNEIEKNLDEILDSSDAKLDLDKNILEPPIFNLSYDQYDNLKINKKIVNVFRKIYPQLNEKFIIEKKNNRIKIGFFSEFFTNHTIGKLFKGLIFNLDKSIFEIIIFHSINTKKSSTFNEFLNSEITQGIKNIILDKNFSEKVTTIRNENLDMVFFPDIGMSTEFYYLSFIRFANVQITSWGHPITSANDSIDFFLSSDLLKSDDDKKNFSEKLIYLKNLPMYFYKPKIKNILGNNEINNQNIYFCSQTLIKFHPHFDQILNKILIDDKKAKIFLIDDYNLGLKLKNRLKNNISNNFERIIFLNKLSLENYINKCGQASVLLDSLYFGAGNSFHESMYYGTPTVTLPTQNLKSRIVFGAYKQMQITTPPIVKNLDDYVGSVVNLANLDPKKILDQKHYYKARAEKFLYENDEFIEEINQLLINLYRNEKT